MGATKSNSTSKRTRVRVTMTCDVCRKRKVKCDKGQPCSSCVKLGSEEKCSYDFSSNSKEKVLSKKGKVKCKIVKDEPTVADVVSYESTQIENDALKARIRQLEFQLEVLNNDIVLKSSVENESVDSLGSEYGYLIQRTEDGNISREVFSNHNWQKFTYQPPYSWKNNSLYIGMNPYHSEKDEIDFFERGSSNKAVQKEINRGPFSWTSLMEREPSLRLIHKYTVKQKSEATKMEKQKLRQVHQDRDVPANFKRLPEDETFIKNSIIKTNTAEETKTVGMSRLYQELIIQIIVLLPHKDVIWKLIDRFFRILYPFISFIDQDDFKNEVRKIIGEESMENIRIKEVKIENTSDLAHLGTLLLVLRLSYLTIFSNRHFSPECMKKRPFDPKSNEENKYLAQLHISMSFVHAAVFCLNNCLLFNKANMAMLQGFILLRKYHSIAPEEGGESHGRKSQMFNGLLINMSFLMGLNRDPDMVENLEISNKAKNLGRKIWHYLVIDDTRLAYTFGNPFISRSIFQDTKIPFYEVECENTPNVELEKNIHCYYKQIEPIIYVHMKNILELSLNFKTKSKVSLFVKELTLLEIKTEDILGSLPNYIGMIDKEDKNIAWLKVMRANTLLSLKCFMLSAYFHLFLFYEEKGNSPLSMFYLKKILAISVGEIIASIAPFICGTDYVFGEGASLILNPMLEQILQRVNDINIIIIVRANTTLYKLKNEKTSTDINLEHIKIVSKFVSQIEKCSRVCLKSISMMSTRYYYAWGILKRQDFLLKTITKGEFYSKNKEHDFGSTLFSFENVSDLVNLSESSLGTLEDLLTHSCNNIEFRALFSIKQVGENQILFTSPRGDTDWLKQKSKIQIQTDFKSESPLSQFEISSQFEDLDFTSDMDQIWFSLLSSKNWYNNSGVGLLTSFDESQYIASTLQSYNEEIFGTNMNNLHLNDSTQRPESYRINDGLSFEKLNDPDSMGHLSLFDDLPLDQIFSQLSEQERA